MMESVRQFNGLNGAIVSREELLKLLFLANSEEQKHIARIIKNVLLQNSDSEFMLEIGSNAIEAIPKSMLNGLQFDDLNEMDSLGLAKPVSADQIYKMVTEIIIEALEKPLTNDWEMEWGSDTNGYSLAYNFVSKKPYRSINQIILNPRLLSPRYEVLKNPYFLTFKQVSDLGGKVKKDSKGQIVTYYSFLYSCVFSDIDVDFKTYDRDKFIAFVKKNNILERLGLKLSIGQFTEQSAIAFLKYYKVFNGSDIEGIDFDLENFSLPGKMEKITNHHEKIDVCESIISSYPKPKPNFTFGGTSAHFDPSKDVINMPNLEQFNYVQAYYTTYFHEMIHSTGVEKRLDRDLSGKMRTKSKELYSKYAFEELIAEIGAMFLCSQAGILHYTLKNSLAYVKGWRDNLVKILKEDNKFVFKAATQSQKAVDFLLENFDFEAKPKEIEKKKKPRKVKTEKPKVVQEVPERRPNYSRKRKYVHKPKVDKNGQTALFGADNGLNSPFVEDVPEEPKAIEEIEVIAPVQIKPTVLDKVTPFSSKYKTAVDRELENKAPKQLYNIKGDLSKFLGKIEIKPVQSLVITLDSGEGGGKTHTLYNWANEFYEAGYKPIIWSLEEHATSGLATDKAEQYFGANKAFIPVESENDGETNKDTVKRMLESIADFDVVLIDSWAKVLELDNTINFDQDLRKKFNGKLFVVVFQRTSDGKMRGGATSGFDGDVILKVEVDRADFRNNYIFNHKNRYNDYMPISDLKYSPYHRALRKTAAEVTTESPKLSFTAIEI